MHNISVSALTGFICTHARRHKAFCSVPRKIFQTISRFGAAARLPAPTPGVRAVHTPHLNWRPGVKQPHPFPGTKMLELSPEKEGFHLYPFVISAFVPRPIAFISSLSKEVRPAQRKQDELPQPLHVKVQP